VSQPSWLQRYKAGERAEVWAEMEALGASIAEGPARKKADAVVRETMKRARSNFQHLFKELPGLGYQFEGPAQAGPRDALLEMRIDHALDYVRAKSGKRANAWAHPALAWIEEEEIELPERFRGGRLARANYRPPSARLNSILDELERSSGTPLTLAARAWFEIVGAVNLKGRHPILNPDGAVAVLRVLPEEATGEPFSVGAGFVARMRRAFEWSGFPGWEARENHPSRELEFLRHELLPL
jgi:hypothetical protein